MDELTEEIYLAAVERAKTDVALAKGLRRLERLNMEVQHRQAEHEDAKKLYQEAEEAIVRHMKVRLE